MKTNLHLEVVRIAAFLWKQLEMFLQLRRLVLTVRSLRIDHIVGPYQSKKWVMAAEQEMRAQSRYRPDVVLTSDVHRATDLEEQLGSSVPRETLRREVQYTTDRTRFGGTHDCFELLVVEFEVVVQDSELVVLRAVLEEQELRQEREVLSVPGVGGIASAERDPGRASGQYRMFPHIVKR